MSILKETHAEMAGRDKRVPGIPATYTDAAKQFLALRPDFAVETQAGLAQIGEAFDAAHKIMLDAIDAEPESPDAHLYIEVELPDIGTEGIDDAETALRTVRIEWLQSTPLAYRRRVVVGFWLT